jgi:hypothetical protein
MAPSIHVAATRKLAEIVENQAAEGIAATHPPASVDAIASSLRAGRRLSKAFSLLSEVD